MTRLAPSPLHVTTHGSGEPSLVLIHGLGAHGHFWRRWLPHLAPHYRTHTVDLMGAGHAPAPRRADYSPAGQARHLARFVRSLEGEPTVLVGHSLGGGIALLTTLLLLDETPASAPIGVILASAAVYEQRLPRFLSLARVPGIGELFLLAPPPRWALRAGIRGIVHDPSAVDARMVEGYREPFRTLRRRRAAIASARQIDPGAGSALARRLPEVKLPALLIWGEEDRIVPRESGIRLRDELPDAQLVTLPGVGHLPPEEDPRGSVAPAVRFLRSLGHRPGPRTASIP